MSNLTAITQTSAKPQPAQKAHKAATNIAGEAIREALLKEAKTNLVIETLELNYQMFNAQNEPTNQANKVQEISITGCAHVLEITPYYVRLKIENPNSANAHIGIGQYFTNTEIANCIAGLNRELNR